MHEAFNQWFNSWGFIKQICSCEDIHCWTNQNQNKQKAQTSTQRELTEQAITYPGGGVLGRHLMTAVRLLGYKSAGEMCVRVDEERIPGYFARWIKQDADRYM